MIRSVKFKWAGSIAHIGERRKAYKILVSDGKRL
jgi:hypothetical protein